MILMVVMIVVVSVMVLLLLIAMLIRVKGVLGVSETRFFSASRPTAMLGLVSCGDRRVIVVKILPA